MPHRSMAVGSLAICDLSFAANLRLCTVSVKTPSRGRKVCGLAAGFGTRTRSSGKRIQYSTPDPLDGVKHKEYEEDIDSERAHEKKVVENVDSEGFLSIAQGVGDVLHPQEEHQTKKVEHCADDLPQS